MKVRYGKIFKIEIKGNQIYKQAKLKLNKKHTISQESDIISKLAQQFNLENETDSFTDWGTQLV